MVIAFVGTLSIESKNLELASIVSLVKSIKWVESTNSSSGSLKAMCQFLPMPNI